MQEEYEYEDNDSLYEGAKRKKIIMSVLLVLALILIIILMRSCASRSKVTVDIDYEKILLDAGKKYANTNKQLLPSAKGQCTVIDLNLLSYDQEISNNKDFQTCDKNKTYVKICKLGNNNLQYTPWLSCTKKNSENEYGTSKEGEYKDIVTNSTSVSFMFLPQVIKSEEDTLGPEEEYWQEDIPYTAYKTLETIQYYRYKDQQWIWNTYSKKYYSSNGEKNKASDVKEYYTVSPASGYNYKDNGATVYKWYKPGAQEKEYYKEGGKEVYTASAPSGYPNKDESQQKIEVYYMVIEGVTSAKKYNVCAKDEKKIQLVNQEAPCGSEPNTAYKYFVKSLYKCPSGYENVKGGTITESTKCVKTSGGAVKACPNGKTCVRGESKSYKWYKYVQSNAKIYYPSNSTTASGEKMYFKDSPASGLTKDEGTKTTGYKFYKRIPGQTSSYYSTAPSSGATKTSQTKWTDWTDWDSKEPEKKDYRNIETKTKIKLRPIKDATDGDFKDVSEEYMSEQELIEKFKSLGYDVNSLVDIVNNGELSYKIKMYVRNKKEASK